jgi:hypothetical protein
VTEAAEVVESPTMESTAMKSAMEMLRGCNLWNRCRQAKGQDHTRQQFAESGHCSTSAVR